MLSALVRLTHSFTNIHCEHLLWSGLCWGDQDRKGPAPHEQRCSWTCEQIRKREISGVGVGRGQSRGPLPGDDMSPKPKW